MYYYFPNTFPITYQYKLYGKGHFNVFLDFRVHESFVKVDEDKADESRY